MPIDTDFSAWLQKQLDRHEWTRAEFSRRSGISRPQITRILNREQEPGRESLTSIAQALKLHPNIVFRAAGFLPPTDETTDIIEQALFDMGFLPLVDQEEIAEFIKLKRSIHERREKYKP